MKITILNGVPDASYGAFNRALDKFAQYQTDGYDITLFNLKDMDIHYCTGCFGCWVKTPGQCVFKDDMETILKTQIASDIVLYATPVLAGTMSSHVKKALDRSIPQVLPYIRLYKGECHHLLRYDRLPDIGILLFDDGKIDDESKEILYHMMDRLARNFRSQTTYKMTAKADQIAEVIQHEISAR